MGHQIKKISKSYLQILKICNFRNLKVDLFIKRKFSSNFKSKEKEQCIPVPKEYNLRNIGIMAHIDAGKTTTTERMLYYSGFTRLMGEVHDGNTVTDYMDQERERGITITSAAVSFPWNKNIINLIDTPGHVDFTIEVERSLRVLDGAVAVFDASAGVEAQSMTVWLQADRYSLPRIAYLNKMDKEGANLAMCLSHFKKKLNATALLTQKPIGKDKSFEGVVDLISMRKLLWDRSEDKSYSIELLSDEKDKQLWEESLELRSSLVEKVADLDNALAEIILEKESTHLVPPEDLLQALRRVTLERSGIPVFVGSSYKNIGVQPLMDAVCNLLPSPLDITHPKVELFAPKLCAVAFKIIHHKKRGPMTFIRIYSGKIEQKQRIYNASKNVVEKIDRIYNASADDFEEIREAQSGSILVATGLTSTITGDTLVQSEQAALEAKSRSKEVLVGVKVPEPVFMCSIEAPSLSQQKTLDLALSCLEKEDPSLRIQVEEDTGQTVLAGMGELHLNVIKERICREYKIEAELGPLFISYRECILDPIRYSSHFDKSIGNSKQSVKIELSLTPEENYNFKKIELKFTKENSENLQFLKARQLDAVTRGVKAALMAGPILRFPVIDVKPQLIFLEMSKRTSSNIIAAAASQCIRQMLKQSECQMLEPVMKIEIVVPEEKSDRVLGELSKRRAHIENVDQRQNIKIISCHCPLAELVGFATTVRQLSSGLASISMEFAFHRHMNEREKQEAILAISGLT